MNVTRSIKKTALSLLTASTLLLQVASAGSQESLNDQAKVTPTVAHEQNPTNDVKQHFNQVIEDIDSTLLSDQQKLQTEPHALQAFVKSNILANWNVELTLKQLLGSKHWKKLNPTEIQSLKSSFEQTLQRYIREGMSYYDGQRVSLKSVKINKKQTRGIVTVLLEPVYLPEFSVTFKIAHKNEQWLLYDVLVEGISYVKMKKQQYRQMVNEKGIDGLLAYLDQKNNPHE